MQKQFENMMIVNDSTSDSEKTETTITYQMIVQSQYKN